MESLQDSSYDSLEVESLVSPEGLVLNGNERVLEVLRQLLIGNYLSVLGVVDLVDKILLIVVDISTYIKSIIYGLRMDRRCVADNMCRISCTCKDSDYHEHDDSSDESPYESYPFLSRLFVRFFLSL